MCMCAGYLKKLLADLNQILWNDRTFAKDKSIRLDFKIDPESGSRSTIDFPCHQHREIEHFTFRHCIELLRKL